MYLALRAALFQLVGTIDLMGTKTPNTCIGFWIIFISREEGDLGLHLPTDPTVFSARDVHIFLILNKFDSLVNKSESVYVIIVIKYLSEDESVHHEINE